MGVNVSKIRPTISSEIMLATVALGAANEEWLSDVEVGKVLKLSTADNYVIADEDDDIEAILRTVEPGTVNQGFCHGSIQKDNMAYAISDGVVAVGNLVVAGPQEALGTENNASLYPIVKAGTPTLINWRVVSIVSGGGADGSVVVIERV